MLILFMIVWGMICGWLAQLILGRSDGMRNTNWTEAIVAGLVGSFVGGLLISLISGDGLELKPSGLVGSVLGAVIVLAIWQAIRGRSAGRT
ncbi:MAG TPA: GlsB/YeaQ/YmgE family stress response membrane protein [Actinomycetota bacterium]|nr:GlsB/YeaQ/YmgE family stress response membrane protein [Actinomycetota bacterium]